jgi:SAM-dependent methyltransferase
MNPVSRIQQRFSHQARRRRAGVFGTHFTITPRTRILDLGSSEGFHIASLLHGLPADPRNVFIADIREDLLNEGRRRYGFTPVLLSESGPLSFPDRSFDIIFCSSVIEHVTIPKEEVWTELSGKRFGSRSLVRQEEFAREIRRVGIGYWVQTPNLFFPLESHSWLPFVGWLPRPAQVRVLRSSNRWWVKRTKPDWHLLRRREMARLFPDAAIVSERWCGLTKSLIAVKGTRAQASGGGS